MTRKSGKHKENRAKEYHKNGQFENAATSYTQAAYEFLGENGLTHSVSAASGLRNLLVGAACFRFQKSTEQCTNHCWQGVYMTEAIAKEAMDLPQEEHSYDQSVRGIWFEFEGDFRTVGGLPGAGSAYDQARSVYRDAGNPDTASFEQYHLAVSAFTKIVFRETDTAADELNTVLRPGHKLTDWIDFKERYLSDALSELYSQENWNYKF